MHLAKEYEGESIDDKIRSKYLEIAVQKQLLKEKASSKNQSKKQKISINDYWENKINFWQVLRRKQLISRGFFHDVEQISKIFASIRATILQLERVDCTMADCFTQLVHLIVTIFHMPKERDTIIPNYQVVVFVINNIVDLHHRAFNQVGDLYVSNEDNINSDVAMNKDYEFNLEELVQDLE
ncbi:25100_t:CDS:2 [Dentiscutata erythropus]|uniref:25100_t:CDS:1 n=1 Tax=Dentiscutata erythropus TaxID=1348616 RepID=A0A9N9GW46_9GLOM|nr:25100_t:CDS:2 [Dentiscutata erythropus]